MINFRYHLVSLIAVFLALSIGIITGTAVIDSAVVDRLEAQQRGLEDDIAEVRAENDRLRRELGDERETSEMLAEEGTQRLLDGALAGVPVLVVGVRGVQSDDLGGLVAILNEADAAYRGTVWLTERFTLDEEVQRRDLAEALPFRFDATAGSLRSAALTRVARVFRPPLTVEPEPAPDVLTSLREAGFLEFEPPDGTPGDVLPAYEPGTRLVVISGPRAEVEAEFLMLPLVRALVAERSDRVSVPVLAVVGTPPADGEPADAFLGPIRDDDQLVARVSSVDNIGEFAGRLASVFALVDFGETRFGHYGRGRGAQRLLPAPPE